VIDLTWNAFIERPLISSAEMLPQLFFWVEEEENT
jgi:hypothetical protein